MPTGLGDKLHSVTYKLGSEILLTFPRELFNLALEFLMVEKTPEIYRVVCETTVRTIFFFLFLSFSIIIK